MRLILGFVLMITVFFVEAQSESKEILVKHYQAIGQEIWDQIPDVTVDARWVDEEYKGYSVDIFFKPPGKIRIEGNFNGRKFIEVTDGQNAWILAPWKEEYEVQKMSFKEQLMLEGIFSLGSPLKKIEGQITFAGLQDYKGTLYLTYVQEYLIGKDDFKRTFFIDRDDYQLYLETYEWGKGEYMEKFYEKYTDYGGLFMPTAIRFEFGDKSRELIFDEAFIGLGVKDQLFNRPESR